METILEPIVGATGVVARVRAEMDWTKSEVTEERFDPDSQVARSEQRTEEEERERIEGGVPGVASNTEAGGEGPAPEPGPSSKSLSETYNYEISKVVSRRSTPMGRVERLSVAVLVDTGGPAEPAGEEGGKERVFSEEELQRFEQLAMQAVGFSEKRGDRIVVSAAPFRAPEFQIEGEAPALDGELLIFLTKVLGIVAQLAALVVFALLIVRPMLGAVAEGGAGAELPAPVSTLEAELAGAGVGVEAAPPPPLTLAEQVGAEAQLRNDDSLTTIRNWLNQG